MADFTYKSAKKYLSSKLNDLSSIKVHPPVNYTVYRVPNCIVVPNSYWHFYDFETAVLESMLDYRNLDAQLSGPFGTLYNHEVKETGSKNITRVNKLPFKVENLIRVNDRALSFSLSQDDKNIYHFLLHTVPKLLTLTFYRSTDYPILIGYEPSALQREILSLINFDIPAIVLEGSPVTELVDKRAYQFREILITDIESLDLASRINICSRMLNVPTLISPKFPKKIYVTRRDVKGNSRILQNQLECEALLVAQGFVPVNMSEYGFIDQVNLYRNAENIVFEHGGAGVFTIFCNRECKLVELLPERNCPTSLGICNTFRDVAEAAGVKYHRLIGKVVQISERQDVYWELDLIALHHRITFDVYR